ncbi:GTPase GUF1 NDAI_0I01850 [Naumovozyma dairenensis CBS 421]|uniref:Tr-type G domain-containing protein n=1 Tax=Naumovozyma dairenensis (strain ATCC 10597 / BCRC 20456 / CBS 421 / NBRC 0211 / NRRL Y-12639) TaxID=1071378 RepID=G0WG43_NAUDC|nr:hypothetical protein NDAI_0I01850 [Naumovozyma dairenensis CBS 421]CCD26754.1 hypothetical protein NDAI_0I01850 [Naumovozyma dairenensis CBS 421]
MRRLLLKRLNIFNQIRPNHNTHAITVKEIKDKLNTTPQSKLRTFSIIAHIDHGKSTLSDRFLQLTNVISQDVSSTRSQILDTLEVERERGITIKAQSCTLFHDGYILQLIDTPGHVDFKSEVMSSMRACDGVVFLVDAIKKVQAQSVAFYKMALGMNLKIIPCINKVDLVDDYQLKLCMDDILKNFKEIKKDDIIKVSGKTGSGVMQDLIPAIITNIPSPSGDHRAPFRGMLLDSWYDSYLGVILLIKVVDGNIKVNDKVISASTGKSYEIKDIGIMFPTRVSIGQLQTGQVGYIIVSMKDSRDAQVGDTFMKLGQETKTKPLPGFIKPQPMVFVGAFPADGIDFKSMDDNIQKLVLNDRSVNLQKESSNALGQGWRLGFLGTLHASVFKERLEKEYNNSQLIITQPTVPYVVKFQDGTESVITNPDDFPQLNSLCRHNGKMQKAIGFQEPYVEATIKTPQEYLGKVITLCDNNRGEQIDVQYDNDGNDVVIKYNLPLSNLVDDFFGKLKSLTKGYGNLDYVDIGNRDSDIIKLELCVNGKSIDALSQIIHRSEVTRKGKEWVVKFKEYIKSQLYEVVIQARMNGNKIIARETIKAQRKDVLAKLHASDVSRRKKLLAKQKEGKQKMKSIGNVQINPEAYRAFLSR